MNRKARSLCLLGALMLVAGCSLRAPSYNPDLGGFPIYQGSSGDRARLYQGIDMKQSETPRKPAREKTALLIAD